MLLKPNNQQIHGSDEYQNVRKSFTYILVIYLHFRTFQNSNTYVLVYRGQNTYILVTYILGPLLTYILGLWPFYLHFGILEVRI